MGLALVTTGCPQHSRVTEGGDATEDEGDDDSDFGGCGKGGQQRSAVRRGPVRADVESQSMEGWEFTAGGGVHFHSLTVESASCENIRTLVEHRDKDSVGAGVKIHFCNERGEIILGSLVTEVTVRRREQCSVSSPATNCTMCTG